ncbi:MAG: hypothetical protein IPL61_04280 [Myxococcales bacterium]|nr:hypothetical protein [Myxococcales bacterium]
MRPRGCALVFAIGGAIAASAGTAVAAPPLAGVAVDGAPSPEAAGAITDGIAAALGHDGPAPGTCATPACASTVLTASGAPRGVVVTVAITGDFHDRFAMTAAIVDDRGRALRRRREDCETCTMGEAVGRARALVTELVDAADDDPVAVALVTTPIDAAFTIDGTTRGTSPWSGSLTAGPHTVVIGTATREIFVEAAAETVTLTLEAPVARRPRSNLRFVPYGVASVGVVALIAGAYLVSVDGDPTCPVPTCPEVRDTGTGGWLLVGAGVASLGTAGYLYWRDRQRARPTLAIVPTSGGAAAVAVGRF